MGSTAVNTIARRHSIGGAVFVIVTDMGEPIHMTPYLLATVVCLARAALRPRYDRMRLGSDYAERPRSPS